MFFRILVVVSVAVLVFSFPAEGCRRRRRSSRPPLPDNPPRFTYCTSGIIRRSYSTTEANGRRVYYSTPTATDDKRGSVVRRTSGLPSGSRFPEGTSIVSFEVRDTKGQKAYCNIAITVRVYRCSAVSHSSNRWHSCTHSNFVGSVCTFHCSSGYSISGSTTSTCSYYRYYLWSYYWYYSWSSQFPKCKVKTCSLVLQSIPNGGVTCTNSNRYNSICTYYCNSGYGFPSGSTTWRVCRETWSGTTPTCVDTQAPTFSYCPSSFSVEAGDATTSAVVKWTTPTATDNIPDDLTVFQTAGSPPANRLNQGSYLIEYRAKDKQGNVRYCTFSVTVIVISCRGLTPSEGLVITCPNNYAKGASCTFGCATGYQLVGQNTVTTCQSNRIWSPSQPHCQILTCPALDPPDHGGFRDGNQCSNTYSSWCYFECNTGFSITGSSARRCVTRGQNPDTVSTFWSGNKTGCQPSTCEKPSSTVLFPEESNTCPAGNPVPYNSTCSFNCTEGYVMQGGSSFTCGNEGQWLQSLPQCEEITCDNSDLPVPNNGSKSGCSGDYESYGTTCTLSCNRGYTPTSAVQRTCQSDGVSGVWSGGTISCTAVTCPPLSMPAKGIVSRCVRNGQDRPTTGIQLFDTTCTLACNEGYTLFGTSSRNCLVSGIWDGSSVQCNDVTSPLVQCPQAQVFFAAIGQSMVSLSWQWEPVMGTDAGQDIPASLQTINSDPVSGTRPTALTEGTHTLVYVATDRAGNSGSCSMQIEAKVTRCTGLTTPLNGKMRRVSGHGSCIEGAVYGSRCEVTCDTNHTLSTEGTTLVRQCDRLSNRSTVGYWTQNQPSCNVNVCSFPNINNGYIAGCQGDSASCGDSCEFHCDLGRRTSSGQNFRVRQCQADTSWSGPDFQCTVTVTCPGPFSITHGSVQPPVCSQASILPYSTECLFSCNNGFVQQGPSIKKCTDDGSWDKTQTTLCTDQQKPSFENITCPVWITVTSAFGSTFQLVDFDVPTATDNSGNVTVRRQSGHPAPGSAFPEGRTTVTYIATDLSGNSQLCDILVTINVYRCGRLQAPASGSMYCNHTAHIVGTQCVLECNTGYTLNGSDMRTCRLNGDNTPYWDGQSTVCTIVTCPSQAVPANAIKSGCSSSLDASETYGTACSFYCMYGFQTESSDDGRSRCLENGTWSGTDLVCTKTTCPMLSPASGVTLIPNSCNRSEPVFGDNCLLSCAKTGFRVMSLGSDYVTCLGNGQWSQNISSIRCVDRQNPQFTSCPSVQTVYALNGSSSAEVTWSISATDNDDLPPTVTCDTGSGGRFDIGLHWVMCTAQDAAGKTATCNFKIEVLQRRCSFLSPPHFGEFVGECSSIHGSVCQIQCLGGYVLHGSDRVTCEFNGTNTYWQRDETPSCNFVNCDALPLPSGVHIDPSFCAVRKLAVGSQCSFYCPNSLSLSSNISLVVCEDDGTWSAELSDLPTHCEDRVHPTLSFCPGSIQATVEDQNGVSVTFDIPTATDNLPSSALTLTTSPVNITSPYLFIGTTNVSYTFTDEAGNSVTCTFRVSVTDELKPKITFCPAGYNITAQQQPTVVTWDLPTFEDLRGDDLQISHNRGTGNSASFYWGTHSLVYTATDTDNGQMAGCEFVITLTPIECPSLDAPLNGALACSLQSGGQSCTMSCGNNYDIPRFQSNMQLGKQYVCGSSGLWTPSSVVPDCSEIKDPRRANLPTELMYFSTDCTSQSTRDSIAQAFIDILQASRFAESCDPNDQCTAGNVEVTCGASSGRRRRRSYEEDGYQQQRRLQRAEVDELGLRSMELQRNKQRAQAHNRQRRQSLTFEVFISFEFSINIHHSEGVDSFDATIDAEDKMVEIADDFFTKVNRTVNLPEVMMQLDTTASTYGYAEIDCEPGYIADNDDYVCIACTTGFMFNNSTNECKYCPKGCYQDQQAQLSCIDCPPGTTTATKGAKNETLCKEACPIGHYSVNGVIPCFKCGLGQYQPEPGQTSCLPCPDGTTCSDFGSQSLDQCLETCNPGSVSDTGFVPCTLCERRSYQPKSQQRRCILCPGSNTTINNGSTSLDDCVYIDECASSPCSNGSTCVDLLDGFRCDCQAGYEGDRCQYDIDECLHHRCANNATCVDQRNHYQCLCTPGFEDRVHPTLSFCPGSIQATVEDQNGVSVTFDIPTATDNLPSSALTLTTSPVNITSPYLFIETTDVSYTFTDEAGNSVTCTFRVSVNDELKPKITFCPAGYNITAQQQPTAVTWDLPTFEDLRGNDLQIGHNRGTGNSTSFYWGTHSLVYTATDTNNGQMAVCEFVITLTSMECPSLDAPLNGALACRFQSNGQICTMSCGNNYDIPRLQSNMQLGKQYVCGSSGLWTPSSVVPDCSEIKDPRRANLPTELMYFSGDCTSQSTRDSIAQAFIDILQASRFAESCDPNDQCTAGSVEVTCGASSGRRRRRSYEEDGYQQQRRLQRAEVDGLGLRSMELQRNKQRAQAHNRQRRQSLTFEVFISFEFSINIHHSEGVDSFDATIDAEDRMVEIADDFFTKVNRTVNLPEVMMQLDTTASTYGYAEIDCEPGYIADNNDDYVCIACTTGFMFNNSTNECQYCPKGYYQDQQAQLSCIDCPPGTTTATKGAKNETLCKEACPIGHYSVNGVIPCFKCGLGQYQPQPGQTSCLPCPEGTSCLDYGSQSLDQCLETCNPGSVSDTGFVPCTLCERRSYQPKSQQRHCILCPGSNTTINNGSTSVDDCVYIDECASSPCSNGSTCVDLLDGFRCDCQTGYEGDRCQYVIDERFLRRCANNAICVKQLTHYQCLCTPGFEGDLCDVNIDECDSSPCMNDGVCQDAINGYSCQCASNYIGINCENDKSRCFPSPCENGGNCQPQGSDYLCLCAPGYNGVNCSVDIDECSSSPCQNGGTCRDLLNAFSCECAAGYNGTRCETDLDLCAESPCHQASTCVDQVSTFRCVCPADRVGDLCDRVRTPCDSAPCQNNASCFLSSDFNEYICVCVAGYTGRNCEVDFKECASDPCSNGGTCSEPELNSFMCDCLLGFQGDTCTIDIDECSSNPCGANNTCEDEINGYFCQCGMGLTGDNCEEDIDNCVVLSPCMNGATCSSTGTGYQCTCQPGYRGVNCEVDVDECVSVPCQHSGTCIDQVNGYFCDCIEGFTGSVCDVNVDDCYPGLCENNGTCVDGIDAYTCQCSTGFNGTHCEEPIDYCDGNPCQNGGVCQSQHLSYSCTCLEGYVGPNCEENFDDCWSYPCIYASSCVDHVNNYTCVCKEGYDGFNCEHEINECDSNPCMNKGICWDYIARFVCRCLEGFSGRLCEVNIDDCLDEPCLNGGSCLDETNSFSCVCDEGFTGELCDINIDECESTPCMNGAACRDHLSAYECECLPGYSGDDCGVNINECQQSNAQCQHGGNCIDKVADFACSCQAGYRGRFCDEEINKCESDPCKNGGSCTDGEARFSCSCVSGFTGSRCETQIDLCDELPCSHGATCTSRHGDFSCTCLPGFSGELCDTDVNECVSQPCLNQALCEDRMNGYQCVCLPGYTGIHCETELSADFDLKFSNTSKADMVHVTNLTSRDLFALSASFWMRSVSCHGDFILLMISTNDNPVIKMHDPSVLKLNIVGSETIIETSAMLCDGRWHSVLVTWQGTSQEWKVYIDQSLASEGAVNDSATVTLHRGLMLTIGPDGSEEDFQTFELDLSGVNIWSSALNESKVPDIVSSCRPSLPADVFAWSQMILTPSDAVTQTLRVPSTCDDIDECSSDPCEAGQCEDQLSKFACRCPEGLEGDRCQTRTDYCLKDVCLNNATCQQKETVGYMCVCPVGFNSSRCQSQIIDGGWSPWTTYSNCTVTCDGGTQNRSRVCDNPLPENGGKPCSGEATEVKECNTQQCPACQKLLNPFRGKKDCNETADKEMYCTISCRQGYTFDMTPLSIYHCGPSSSYRWSHENKDNPRARFPQCVEAKPITGFTGKMSCSFNGVSCSSEADMAAIKSSADSSLSQQKSLSCMKDQTCKTEVSVSNCNHGDRVARQAASGIQLTVTIFINLTGAGNATGNGTENDGLALVESVVGLDSVVQSGGFMLEINGEVKVPDPNSIVTDAQNMCPEGTAQTEDGYCVECGPGTFLFQSSDTDFECLPCPVGTYQDQEGQSSCINCPSEMVTYGKGASNINECFALCEKGSYRVWSDVIGVNQCDLCPRNTFSNETGMEYCIECPEGMITDGPGAISSTDCYPQCGEGKFRVWSDVTGDYECEPCPLNTYKTGDSVGSCTACPDGTITDETGARSITDCHDLSSTTTTTTTTTVTPAAAAGGINAIFVVIGIAGLFALFITIILLCFLVKKLTVRNEVSQSPVPDSPSEAFELQPQTSNRYLLDQGQAVPSCLPPAYEAICSITEKPSLSPDCHSSQMALTNKDSLQGTTST